MGRSTSKIQTRQTNISPRPPPNLPWKTPTINQTHTGNIIIVSTAGVTGGGSRVMSSLLVRFGGERRSWNSSLMVLLESRRRQNRVIVLLKVWISCLTMTALLRTLCFLLLLCWRGNSESWAEGGRSWWKVSASPSVCSLRIMFWMVWLLSFFWLKGNSATLRWCV